ncbi:hypothetical protein [Rhizobium sp. RAF56]|uniref:hypothetical protein n=1 Tax=Rhizobium sp. RAF56 TaxID=3233062 RepID=UPI003F9D61F1
MIAVYRKENDDNIDQDTLGRAPRPGDNSELVLGNQTMDDRDDSADDEDGRQKSSSFFAA